LVNPEFAKKEIIMENIFIIAALWLGLAVFSAILAHHLRISIALVEICIGVIAANIVGYFFMKQTHLLTCFIIGFYGLYL